jgi:hypothetical protein
MAGDLRGDQLRPVVSLILAGRPYPPGIRSAIVAVMATSRQLAGLASLGAVLLWTAACGSSNPLSTSEAGVTGGSGGGAAGAGGAGGAGGGSAGSGGTAPDGGGTTDAAPSCDGGCGQARACCGGRCVNTANDPFNCGQCGVRCEGATPYCAGTCQAAPCEGKACSAGQCCGTQCCGTGQLCCQDQGPVSRAPACYAPTADQPTCPQGCAPLCRSDRDQKKNITPVDRDAVLERLRRLPVATWSYRNEPEGVRHMGPMAQDFRAAFGLGDDDRSYHSVDAHGVALAAIQALERITADQRRRLEALEARNQALERKLRKLEARK